MCGRLVRTDGEIMDVTGPSIYVCSDQPDDAERLVLDLRGHGFIAKAKIGAEGLRDFGPNPLDIFVLSGSRGSGAAWEQKIIQNVIDGRRVIAIYAGIGREDFSALHEMGVEYANTAPKTSIENLIYIISCLDPDVAFLASKRQALQAAKSLAVENVVTSMFKLLRSDTAAVSLQTAKAPRRDMEELISLSPMCVWLDLFRNYHDETAQHCSLVSGFALVFAMTLGLGRNSIERLYDAAFFHDVGKAFVPLEILNKPGRLSASDWEIMKKHTIYGYEILSRDERTSGEIARVARDHHEYLDGTGYPNGIKASSIDELTRILTICDIYAALLERRAYKTSNTADEAYSILKSMAGTKLDKDLVGIFEYVAAGCAEVKSKKP